MDRVRRNLATLVVLALLPLLATVSGCTGADDPPPLPVRISAYLKSDATDAQRTAAEDRIRSLPGVTSVAFVGREQAWERFKETFKDDPDLIAATKPESLPDSLDGRVTDGSIAEAVQLVVGRLDGISDTTLTTGDGDLKRHDQTGILVRLTTGVTDDQRTSIERLIRSLPRTESIRYETREQTKARLLRRCKGDLATALEQIPTQDIKDSFRFRIGLRGDKIPQLSDLQTLDGVTEMVFVPVEVV